MTSPYADLRARLAPLAAAATERPWFYNSYSRVSAAEYLARDEEAGEGAPEDCIWPHRHRCTACVEMLHLTPEGKRYEVLTCQAPIDLYEADSTVCTVPAHHGDTATGRHAADAAFIAELVNVYPEIMALLARGEAAEADAVRLTVILRTPYPVGAYVRWSRNGNTEDADALNHYEEDREAALRLHDEAVALRERPS